VTSSSIGQVATYSHLPFFVPNNRKPAVFENIVIIVAAFAVGWLVGGLLDRLKQRR